jgi:dephospho-CoA kinase
MPEAVRCDDIIEVRAPLLLRLARARKRDGLDALAAPRRILREGALWKKRRELGRPFFVLRNGKSQERLARILDRLLAVIPR